MKNGRHKPLRKQISRLDTKLSQRCTLPPESKWWQWVRLVAHIGDGPYVFGGLAGVYLLGWLLADADLRRADLVIALIVLAAVSVVTLIKFVIQRERPQPPGEFVTFDYDAYSFPSGHSGRMAALAVSTLFFYPLVGLVLLLITFTVAAARVAVGVHYVGDILVGLGIGALVAWIGCLSILSFL